MPKPVVAYIDGGARGNPGPAGYGVHVETTDGHLLSGGNWSVACYPEGKTGFSDPSATLFFRSSPSGDQFTLRRDSQCFF